MSTTYTPSQQNVIDIRGKNMLVSASAGTGKTTVMIERIATLIKEGLDVSQMVVVTFTNLAAAEMKSRLAVKLNEYSDDVRIREQLENLDNSAICTLHSFCSDLLRNYFYVVDVDPSFGILDNVTVNALKKSCLDDLFKYYFSQNDQQFRALYRIFATNRKEDNFKSVITNLYEFSRNIVDFGEWYKQKRQAITTHDENNPIQQILLQDISQNLTNFCNIFSNLADRCQQQGLSYVGDVCSYNAHLLEQIDKTNLAQALKGISLVEFLSMPRKNKSRRGNVAEEFDDKIRLDYKEVMEDCKGFLSNYRDLSHGQSLEKLWEEMDFSLSLCDKLVEMVQKFSQDFFALKKQRGGVDFGDLEHLTLQILAHSETLQAIKNRYKMIFVDEYQDTNPIQEAIVSALCSANCLFMVGDVKQSIYGFRGCEPNIFIQKYNNYKATKQGHVEELNDNFRSNYQILDFVNVVFNNVMTESFGKVDYQGSAQLKGKTPPTLHTPSVRVDLLLQSKAKQEPVWDFYDITADVADEEAISQADLVCKRIKQYVGMAYKDKDGNAKRIEYGDVVILMRSLTHKAVAIYNTLVENNVPVTANFKTEGFLNKEVRELVNLLRVIDNPYNDIYLVGTCLSCFGGFSESELAKIRLDTDGRVPFFDRLLQYQQLFDNQISAKINNLTQLLESLRFYSRGASVCQVLLQIIKQTNYHLYVQGLPNGALRHRKLNNFVDSLKDASFAQTIDKFLDYVDESQDAKSEEALANTNAVRIMTMHASKGLEFPVVIIAGTETRFRFDERAADRNLDLGIATKYYDFATMKKYPTLGSVACSLCNKIKQREEEMRLLYVAMTRAKFVLDVVGTITQNKLDGLAPIPNTAMCHLDWLMYALKQTYPNLSANEQKLCIEIVDEVVDEQVVTQDTLCEQYTDQQAVLQKLEFVYPFQNQTKMPSKIVSSALDKHYFDDEQLKPAPVLVVDDRNKVGTAYHAVYQFVNYDSNVDQIRQTILGLVNEGKVEEQHAQRLDVDLIFATLNNPQLRSIMAQGKVYHEIPFMLYAPYDSLAKDKRFSDKVMLQGVIDLLVVGQNKAIVVDFKYTSHPERIKQNYQYQLNSYKMAVQSICGIADVDCYVLSIADNKIIKM